MARAITGYFLIANNNDNEKVKKYKLSIRAIFAITSEYGDRKTERIKNKDTKYNNIFFPISSFAILSIIKMLKMYSPDEIHLVSSKLYPNIL